ncbi:MAG: hypothetical protein ACR2PX_19130 [Endozoicomonas sp.]|uniref:hypothetical protein n=1 Tax=Endozoicomonas sp. TaxID=1892382 RepID=UPI003D9B9E3E
MTTSGRFFRTGKGLSWIALCLAQQAFASVHHYVMEVAGEHEIGNADLFVSEAQPAVDSFAPRQTKNALKDEFTLESWFRRCVMPHSASLESTLSAATVFTMNPVDAVLHLYIEEENCLAESISLEEHFDDQYPIFRQVLNDDSSDLEWKLFKRPEVTSRMILKKYSRQRELEWTAEQKWKMNVSVPYSPGSIHVLTQEVEQHDPYDRHAIFPLHHQQVAEASLSTSHRVKVMSLMAHYAYTNSDRLLDESELEEPWYFLNRPGVFHVDWKNAQSMATESARVRVRVKDDLIRLYKTDKTGGWKKQEKPTAVTLYHFKFGQSSMELKVWCQNGNRIPVGWEYLSLSAAPLRSGLVGARRYVRYISVLPATQESEKVKVDAVTGNPVEERQREKKDHDVERHESELLQDVSVAMNWPSKPDTTSYKSSNQGGLLFSMILILMDRGVLPVSK